MFGRNAMTGITIMFLIVLFSTVPISVNDLWAESIELKFANYYPPPAPQSKICEEFISELEARTGGRVKVRYFAGGSLLNGPAMIKGVESGIADIGLAHIQYTAGRMSVSEASDLPHGFPSVWVATQVVNDFYHAYQPEEWSKVKPLVLFTNSPSILITDKPVNRVEDLKGMIIRAPGPIGEVIKALGGTPAPTPIVETYDAIAKGVVNGAFVSPEAVRTFRFAEVAKHITMSWNVGSSYTFFIVMNREKYEALPEDVKEVLNQLAGQYKERMPLMWNSIDLGGLNYAREQNVSINKLSEEESDRWMQLALPVIDQYVERMVDKGYEKSEVMEWLSFINERSEYWTQKQVELKIQTATGIEQMVSQ